MAKDTSRESRSEKESDAQPGRAASYAAWIQEVFLKAFSTLGKAHGERRMELLDTLQLGGKRQLLLVLCDGHRYLVGAGGDSVHSIAAMAAYPAQTPSEVKTPSAEFEMGCRN